MTFDFGNFLYSIIIEIILRDCTRYYSEMKNL